jgi:hypothetical protein
VTIPSSRTNAHTICNSIMWFIFSLRKKLTIRNCMRIYHIYLQNSYDESKLWISITLSPTWAVWVQTAQTQMFNFSGTISSIYWYPWIISPQINIRESFGIPHHEASLVPAPSSVRTKYNVQIWIIIYIQKHDCTCNREEKSPAVHTSATQVQYIA